MSCKDRDTRLNDYVDGALTKEERDEVERHLEACPSCRESAEAIRALVSRAAGLPRERAPDRDLWPGIEAALSDERDGSSSRTGNAPGRPGFLRWAGMAAALVLLVAASVGITLLVTERGAGEVVGAPVTDGLAAYRAGEGEYRRAAAELTALIEQNRDRLAPETVAVVEENLEIIDAAIAEARAALESDPGNPRLGRLLTAIHRQRVDMLRRTARLSLQS
jgi:anti-sigma factor RsiW